MSLCHFDEHLSISSRIIPDYHIKLLLLTNPPQRGVEELITDVHDVRYRSP